MLAFIERHKIIGVYCHQNPDGDAKGSQWGIALWLRAMFPHKDIRVVGTQEAYDNFFPKNDTSMIQEQHAALIVDTANLARVDGTLEFAIDMFKIDHHPNVEPYGSGMLVDDTRASCAEIMNKEAFIMTCYTNVHKKSLLIHKNYSTCAIITL